MSRTRGGMMGKWQRGVGLGLMLALMLAMAWLGQAGAIAEGEVETFLPLALNQAPTPTPTATPGSAPPTDWRGRVGYYRALAGLPSVAEQSEWGAGGVLHSRYMVKNDQIGHAEEAGNPWFTPEGDAAGRNGNVALFSSISATDAQAVDLWMEGPFHAIGILDPKLHTSAFGSYREAIGQWRMGATLDVLRGRGALPPGTAFPLAWPQGNVYVPLRYRGTEFPDPLSSCPGYSAPSGLPLILQLGAGGVTPTVTAHSLLRDGSPIEHCLFDETSYANANGSAQSLGRNVLASRDAVVIMPRAPLQVGARYSVSITANGQVHSWSFSVAGAALQNAPQGAARMR